MGSIASYKSAVNRSFDAEVIVVLIPHKKLEYLYEVKCGPFINPECIAISSFDFTFAFKIFL